MKEDDIEIEIKNGNDRNEIKSYRANKYIKEFYKNQENMTKELFKNKILTYKLIADITGLTEAIVKNIIEKQNKTVENRPRRLIHLFFNNDFYEKELGKYNKICKKCKKNCKQYYYINIIQCSKNKKKKNKK